MNQMQQSPDPYNNLLPHELDDLVADIQAFIGSKSYGLIKALMVSRAIQELQAAEVGGLTATSVHARIKGLAELEAEFRVVINEVTMRQGRKNVRTR